MNGQNRLRCVRRDADHGCDPSFVEDPTGSISIVMVRKFSLNLHAYICRGHKYVHEYMHIYMHTKFYFILGTTFWWQ